MDDVLTHLTTLLSGKFEVPPDLITPAATLGELDLDSLAAVELYVTLQEHWNVPLDDNDATPERSVGQIAETVETLLSERGPQAAGHGAP